MPAVREKRSRYLRNEAERKCSESEISSGIVQHMTKMFLQVGEKVLGMLEGGWDYPFFYLEPGGEYEVWRNGHR